MARQLEIDVSVDQSWSIDLGDELAETLQSTYSVKVGLFDGLEIIGMCPAHHVSHFAHVIKDHDIIVQRQMHIWQFSVVFRRPIEREFLRVDIPNRIVSCISNPTSRENVREAVDWDRSPLSTDPDRNLKYCVICVRSVMRDRSVYFNGVLFLCNRPGSVFVIQHDHLVAHGGHFQCGTGTDERKASV